ncbi:MULTISPECIES: Fic family protein [Aeromonas]|uniref:Fic family protein n=1 Tax=Aeromonas TaxID=642 RepID=UPI00191DF66A|nr:Fic family protein [Aeromonas veronii]MBL0473685.1 Fic family protein [Aeromonas veronii]MCR3960968.1 Fic family protein [Aeromonas veronii]UPK56489.1 Fic family protein [Aeromonas veronii]WFO52317.1 Fic family protein [Aeromonas veronii]
MTVDWIWQHEDWPHFCWQERLLLPRLRLAHRNLGLLQGLHLSAHSTTLAHQTHALDTLLANIVASSAIENQQLNAQSLRASLACRLGIVEQSPYPTSVRSEGLAAMIVDAISSDEQLTLERLLQWHRWLFPADDRRSHQIRVGQLRGDEPMQVISGARDRLIVHFEAPPREGLGQALATFIDWFNTSFDDPCLDPLLRAAICQLWFVTLHPFDDGNGRISRALTDLALSQADNQSISLYAISTVIFERRADYYRALEQTQRGGLDITPWLVWFLDTLNVTLEQAQQSCTQTLARQRFWQQHANDQLCPEQVMILNYLIGSDDDRCLQSISASQYQIIAQVSKSTATRHLTDLLEKNCLEKEPGGGRNTRYRLKLTPEK